VLHGGGEPAAAVLGREVAGSLKVEEEEGHRVSHGSEWPGGPNATWAGAERKQRRKRDGPQG
jgi:hypothetical protein